MAPASIEEAAQYRLRVSRRLSQRNLLAALATALGGAAGLAAALHTGNKEFTISLLAGVPVGILCHIHSLLRPQVACPNCADNWEYDGFLKATACETCGLELPTTKATGMVG